tara:strand:+ start:230 stop:988 length:759 start_codon:yes stop_codon:yes gene_type:complete
MVNIDSVYQKVLALANKEQRGYITPQEFNLFADKAQVEIFENYFHDMKTAYHKPKNDFKASDDIEVISEKLQIFKSANTGNTIQTGNNGTATNTINLNLLTVPVYRLESIMLDYNQVTPYGPTVPKNVEVVELTRRENKYAESNPLTKATRGRPTYIREGNNYIKIFPMPEADDLLNFYYWRRPNKPTWGYVVVNGKALYNYKNSTNFELHPSEEENLVTRILALAGIAMNKLNITQLAMADKASTKQDQND